MNRIDAKNQKKTGWMIYSPVFDDVLKMICSPLTELQEASRPLQNAPFCPIPASGSNFNPQNTQSIPVVKIFAFLGLEQN